MSTQIAPQAPAPWRYSKVTEATPTPSVAVPSTVIVPRTRPAAGLVSATTGPRLSMRRLVCTVEAVVLPALSVASTRMS